MGHRKVRLLDLLSRITWSSDSYICYWDSVAGRLARQKYRRKTKRSCPLNGQQHVWRIAAGGNCNQYVLRASERLHLSFEYMFEPKVIGNRR